MPKTWLHSQKILFMEYVLLYAMILDTGRWAHINVKLHFFDCATFKHDDLKLYSWTDMDSSRKKQIEYCGERTH